ncbi:hypothetical protein [Actinacidiphila sp. bgisy167]|uniref:hypothetical protein n=1 Tax=Actinacidiphila sp. bgisy167 TaxID=3413797 RepID=UPI003D731984
MSPDRRSPSPRTFRRYGRLTGVVVPLAVAAAAATAPVLATTPGSMSSAAATRAAVDDPRPPGTRSVASDDEEEEDGEGEGGGKEKDRDGGGRERTDQRGGRETDRGDNGRNEGEDREQRGDQRDQGRDQRGDQRDQGREQRGDQRDQGRDQRGDQRQQQPRDDQGGNLGGRAGDCVSIDSTLRGGDQEITVAVFDGRVFIGGRTLPRGRFVWHSLSGNRGYPRGVCGATVTAAGSGVWVKAITRDGRVVETHCAVNEAPGGKSSCSEWRALESHSFRSPAR